MTLLEALEYARAHFRISKEEVAQRMGKQRVVISRLLNDEAANPTLSTVLNLLTALGLAADITLRPAAEGEEPLKVAVAFS